MTDKELLHTIGDIDESFIAEAAPVRKKKPAWTGWAAVACLVLVAGLLAFSLPRDTPRPDGRYKYTLTQQEVAAAVLRWEDQTLSERYTSMIFADTEYKTRGLALDASLLGNELGACDAWGQDHYTGQTHHQEFAAYEISGIQYEKLIAVCMEDKYYVFMRDGYAPPATLGGLLEAYNLEEYLPLTHFSYGEAHYILEEDAEIWRILAECADAPVMEDDFRVNGDYVSFTATSEALGIYKRVLYITADGFVKTNALDYGYVYFIGEDAAERIIDYCLANAAETEMEPYTNFLVGTITEIGDGYILVSDAVLCWDEADGIEYKVLSTDPLFSRWFQYYNLQMGDVVYIQYRGDMGAGNVIPGAYSISKAVISGGDILIHE